jgi:Tubulin folding cofactor D C terminal
VPFDLQSVDSAKGGEKLVERLISAFKGLLADCGKTRDAAAVCIARLLSRPDLDSEHLKSFLSWADVALETCFERDNESRPLTAPGDAVSAAVAAGRNSETAFATKAATRLGLPIGSVTGSSRSFLATGVLQALVEIAKHGHRHSLLSVLQENFSRILEILGSATDGGSAASAGAGSVTATNTAGPLRAAVLLRKLIIKLAARTSLQYLPPRLAHWRYQRARRTLLRESGGAAANSGSSSSEHATTAISAADDEPEVPVEVESTLDMLLQGLRDSDTIVRWSAAKGLGRVTGRLPEAFGDDVVQAVLDCLTPAETDASWHGGCLALAELARRGLLLPVRLELAVPRLLAALQYDVRRGAHSIGAHVRDAACYVCWAFARAYDPRVLRPHVLPLARGMIITALFDREVNCRRAASAAFQEHVGRQGGDCIPDGIAVLTLADYHSLGNRRHSFLHVASQVAAFPAYRYSLVEHLLSTKLKHWDKDIRVLAAESLGLMCGTDAEWFKATALPSLLAQITSTDLFARHGAILAIAEICLGLARVPSLLHPSLLDPIRNVVVKAEKARVYTGRGGEMVRVAMCRLIASQCLSDHPISRKAALRFLQTVDDCLKHPNEAVQEEALGALRALGALPTVNEFEDTSLVQRLPQTYLLKLNTDDNPAVRRGMALAIGALPRSLLCSPVLLKKTDVAYQSPPTVAGSATGSSATSGASDGTAAATVSVLDALLDGLIMATKQEKQMVKRDAETRRNAVLGLVELVCTVGFGVRSQASTAPAEGSLQRHVSQELLPGLTAAQLSRAWDALHAATHDYATDNRGDVGSWVRKAALEGMEKVVLAMTETVATETATQELLAASHSASTSTETMRHKLASLSAATPSLVASLLFQHQHQQPSSAKKGKATLITAKGGLPLGARVVVGQHSTEGVVTKLVASGTVCEVSGLEGSPSFPYGRALVRAEALSLAAQRESGSPAVAVVSNDAPSSFLRTFLSDRYRMSEQFVGAALRIACEKLDLLRGLAAEVLSRVAHSGSLLATGCGIAHLDALKRAFHFHHGQSSLAAHDDEQGQDDEESSLHDDGESHHSTSAAPPPSSLAAAVAELSAIESESNIFARVVPLLAVGHDGNEDSTSNDDDRFIYSQHILAGLVTAVGGLSESVVKQASKALCDWCIKVSTSSGTSAGAAAVATVARTITAFLHPRPTRLWDLHVDGAMPAGTASASAGAGASLEPHDVAMAKWFKQILGVSSGVSSSSSSSGGSSRSGGGKLDYRLLTPAIKTLDVVARHEPVMLALLSAGGGGAEEEIIRAASNRAYASSQDAARISAVADLCLTFLGAGSSSSITTFATSAVTLLLDVLGHPFPKLRRQTAEKLYVRLLTVGLPSSATAHNSAAKLDDALDLLTSTPWDGPLEGVLPQRDMLYPLLGITTPPEARSGVDPSIFSLESSGSGGAGAGGRAGGGGAGGGDDGLLDEGYGNLVKDAGY